MWVIEIEPATASWYFCFRDLDQIDATLQAQDKVDQLLTQQIDYEKTGLGQFYCVHCDKYFIDANAFKAHIKSKAHKRRLHALKVEPYSLEEAMRAAGMGSYVKPAQREVSTLLPSAVVAEETLEDVKKRAVDEGSLAEDNDGDVKMWLQPA